MYLSLTGCPFSHILTLLQSIELTTLDTDMISDHLTQPVAPNVHHITPHLSSNSLKFSNTERITISLKISLK